jgi:hypothetical protein
VFLVGSHTRGAVIRKDVRPLAFSMASIGREFERAYARAVTRYIEALKRSTSGAAVVAAIRSGDAEALDRAAAWVEADKQFQRDIERQLLDVVSATGSRAGGRIGVSFTLDNPYSPEWARAHAADLVTMIADTTRDALREFVADAFAAGIPPRELAEQIRDVVGVTPAQAARIRLLREGWKADGLSSSEIASRIASLTDRMVRDRALLIARTEIITAANQGQLASWRVASDRGLVLPTTVKVWIAADWEKCTSGVCPALDGTRAKLGEPFPGGYMAPPRHPACVCTMGLETLTPQAYARIFGG